MLGKHPTQTKKWKVVVLLVVVVSFICDTLRQKNFFLAVKLLFCLE